jgi:NTE family protein
LASLGGEAVSLHAWLQAAPFTLALSGGFFGFFAHTGLLLALEEAGLRPARVTGASAGALAGAVWASGVPGAHLAERLRTLEKRDFWDPGFPWGGLLKGQAFERLVAELVAEQGVTQLEDCPIPTAAVVFDVRRMRARVLDTGPVARAVRASCTVPGLFRPVPWEGTLLLDGGVTDRPGACALRPGERVLYHHLLERGEDPARTPLRGRENTHTLAFPDVPRAGPNRLDEGRAALEHVRAGMRDRLARRAVAWRA